tara:strand:- start:53 stop:286 length:234 start_codon:yes stop_codon:yes gene_type:complete
LKLLHLHHLQLLGRELRLLLHLRHLPLHIQLDIQFLSVHHLFLEEDLREVYFLFLQDLKANLPYQNLNHLVHHLNQL